MALKTYQSIYIITSYAVIMFPCVRTNDFLKPLSGLSYQFTKKFPNYVATRWFRKENERQSILHYKAQYENLVHLPLVTHVCTLYHESWLRSISVFQFPCIFTLLVRRAAARNYYWGVQKLGLGRVLVGDWGQSPRGDRKVEQFRNSLRQ